MVHKKIMTTHTRSSFIQNKILADAARLGAILVPGFVDDDGEVPLLAGVTGCNKERLQGAPDAFERYTEVTPSSIRWNLEELGIIHSAGDLEWTRWGLWVVCKIRGGGGGGGGGKK